MTRLLLTGFEPFGGDAVNPAHEAGHRLAREQVAGADLHYLCLPVVRYEAVAVALKEMLRLRPDAVISLGQAGSRARITPERIAINVDDFRIPDNAGNQPRDEPQVRDGPAAYFTTLPVRAMTDAIVAAGVPAAVSNTAGTFLCNHVAYGLLHAIATGGLPVRAGFVHLPLLPEQAAARPVETPSMTLETMMAGLRAMLAVVTASCRRVEQGDEMTLPRR